MSAPADDSGSTGAALGQARNWIACGRHMVQQQPSLWYGMAAVYIVLGFLLTLIPFMGHLLLILITPMLLAGVIWGRAHPEQAEAAAAPPATSAQALFQAWIAQPAQELMRIFAQTDKIFAAVLLGIVTLGLVMAVKIVGYLFIGGSMISGLAADLAGMVVFWWLGQRIACTLPGEARVSRLNEKSISVGAIISRIHSYCGPNGLSSIV